MKAFYEQVQQLCWGGEWAVGGEEGLHEHGRGVHVVGEPLHQFDQGGPLYQRHPAVLLPFFEHDIVGRVVFREPAVEKYFDKIKKYLLN